MQHSTSLNFYFSFVEIGAVKYNWLLNMRKWSLALVLYISSQTWIQFVWGDVGLAILRSANTGSEFITLLKGEIGVTLSREP
jgi:hypothetical protein